MAKFYFTYGSEGHDFKGGWTVVEAGNRYEAFDIFMAFHQRDENGNILFAGMYDEEEFAQTKMAKNGNLGAYAHESIVVNRKILDGSKKGG